MFKIVIWTQAEVHEVNEHGELSGDPIHKLDRFPLSVEGDTKQKCVDKLKDIIEGMKKICQV